MNFIVNKSEKKKEDEKIQTPYISKMGLIPVSQSTHQNIEPIDLKISGQEIKLLDGEVCEQEDRQKDLSFSQSKVQKPLNDTARLDEFGEERLGNFSEKFRLVLKIESGKTVLEAASEVNWGKSIRTAYDTWNCYKKNGKNGLIDRRWLRTPGSFVLISEVEEIILAWYYERPAAGPRAVWRLVCQTCIDRNLRAPAETTVKNFLSRLSKGEVLARQRQRGLKEFQKQHSSVVVQNRTIFANEIWQGDHTDLPIWTRRKINGEWVPAAVHGSAFLDAHTRANPGFWISHKYPDSWTISILCRQAIMRKDTPGLQACGLPFHIEMDQGADWISQAVRMSLLSLGIQLIIDWAHYPNLKGKIERFFRFVNTSLLVTLPGHHGDVGTSEGAARKRVHEFLTLEQLREEIDRWRVWYHNRIHETTARKPIEMWEETVRFRYPDSEDDLNILLMKYDKQRTILNCGIKLIIDEIKHLYWSPAFDRNARRRVRIRYNPEDMASVLVYCAENGEFICEAWDTRTETSPYTLIDVKNARRQELRRLTGIAQRSKEYYKNVLGKDRLAEQRKDWEEARRIAVQLPEHAPEEKEADEKFKNALETIRQLNRTASSSTGMDDSEGRK